MTPTNPQEKRTMEERAQKIVQICIDKCEPYRTEAIAAALEQACAEAVTEDRKIWDAQHISDLKIQCARAFLDGQVVMKERAAKMAMQIWVCIRCGRESKARGIADEIRALPLEPPK